MWPFLIGVVTGLVCVGGIAWSLKLFYRVTLQKEMTPWDKNWTILFAILIFMGQFILAGLVVFYVPMVKTKPLPFILGLFSMNLGIPILLKGYGQDSDTKNE